MVQVQLCSGFFCCNGTFIWCVCSRCNWESLLTLVTYDLSLQSRAKAVHQLGSISQACSTGMREKRFSAYHPLLARKEPALHAQTKNKITRQFPQITTSKTSSISMQGRQCYPFILKRCIETFLFAWEGSRFYSLLENNTYLNNKCLNNKIRKYVNFNVDFSKTAFHIKK